MKVFGLTGGVGMGKTAAGAFLQQRGVPVIDTDLLARRIVEPGQPALQEIRRAFGDDIVDAEGRLRRDELGCLVFTDTVARRKLEAILHPRIQDLWLEQVQTWRTEGRPLAVIVIPLLFETGAEGRFDATICVACSAATQRRRLLERGWTPEQIEQRIAAQWPVERKMARADFVVWTEGGLEVLSEQLDRMVRAEPASRPTV
jgi:dephospho-CoA kinase